MALSVIGCSGQDGKGGNANKTLLLRVHHAGASRVLADPNATNLVTIGALPETARFKQSCLEKAALSAPEALNLGLTAGHTNFAPLIRPLLDDLWQNESRIEASGAGNSRAVLVAVVLPPARQTAWQQNLARIKETVGERLAVAKEGKWTVVGAGSKAPDTVARFVRLLKTPAAPVLKDGNWMEAFLDLARLGPVLGLGAGANQPDLDLAISSKTGQVRIDGRLLFDKGYAWKPEPWNIPTNIIRDPLVSFTAMNGIAAWLGETKLLRDLKLKSTPTQYFAWALGGMPLLTYGAVPTKDSTNLVTELSRKLPPLAYSRIGEGEVGNFFWISNRTELVWQGLPMISPNLKATNDARHEFVVGGMFPLPPVGKNPPPELFKQVVSTKDLVYYDWEITQERLDSWRQFCRLLPLFTRSRQAPTTLPGQSWLQAVSARLGNTATQITVGSPKELMLARRGYLGLTGYELNMLVRQLDFWGMPKDYGVIKRPKPGDPIPKKGAGKTAK